MAPSERVAVRVCVDDAAQRTRIESALTHAGFDLVEVEPDVLLVDVAATAAGACDLVRSVREAVPTALIVSTGVHATEARIEAAREAGADVHYPCTAAGPSALVEALGLLWAGAVATRAARPEVSGGSRAQIGMDLEALLDPTTGALAEAHVYAHLVEECARAERAGQSLGLLMLDVDHYTEFTERHGEDASLGLLRQVAEAVLAAMPASGSLGRLEDDKFLAVLPETGLDGAVEVAEAARLGVARACRARSSEAEALVTLSVGVASNAEPGGTPDDLLRAAEAALYQAKVRGKDMVCS